MGNINLVVVLIITAVTTYLIRVLPLIIFKKPITNKFIKSFLYYVPYATLSAMTFPAILTATGSYLAGGISLVLGVIVALKSKSPYVFVTLTCCVSALVVLFMQGIIG